MNNDSPNAQGNKVQQFFQPLKAQQRNICNQNFYFLLRSATFARNFLIQLKSTATSRTAEREYRTKLKCKITSTISSTKHIANSEILTVQKEKA